MNKDFNYEQNLALDNPINIDLQVSAGAGSGKTKTLSEKVMLLIEQGLKPSELLVLTFTNNAAHEMKERIIQKFEGNKDIAYELASAHIQTFDSFSQYLVSRYSGELKVAEQLSIIDKNVQNTKIKEFVDQIFDEYYSDNEKNKAFLRTLLKFNLRDDEISKAVVIDIVDHISKLPLNEQDKFLNHYDETFLSREFFDSNVNDLVKSAKTIIKDKIFYAYFKEKYQDAIDSADYLTLKSIFSNPNNFNFDIDKLMFLDTELADPLYHAYLDLLKLDGKAFIDKAKTFINDNNDLFTKKRNVSVSYKTLKSLINTTKKNDLSFITDIKDLDEEYKKLIHFKDDIHLYLDIVKEVFRRLNEYKKITNCFTFGDISNMALSLMIDPQYEDIAEEIRSRFKFIMVDEYQDTNDLQEAFINSLLKTNKKGERSHLFCVGDAKQSIYAFRDSNVALFTNRQKQYESISNDVARAIPMNKNYRSGKKLLDDINHIFNFYMTIDNGGIAYHKLSESLQYDSVINLYREPYDNFGVHRITSLSSINNDNAPYGSKEWEARAIAANIKDKIDNGFLISERSKNGNIIRKCDYKDFCILVGVKEGVDLYQKVFQEYGIPLNCKIEKDLNESDPITVIKSLIGMMQYIALDKQSDPLFAHMFASVARSYIFEYDDQTIFDLLNDPSHEYVVLNHDPIVLQIMDFMNKYQKSSFGQIFIELLIEFKVVEKLYKIGDVDNSISKIESLYLMAISQQKAGEGMNEFIALMDNIKKYKTELSSESLYQVDNAVDMMTIHGSKGLERKIVYMPCSYNYITKGKSGSQPDYAFSRKYGILLPYYNYQFDNCPIEEVDKSFPTLSINHLMVAQLNEEAKVKIDEHVRLFYVALTRAENAVYIVGDLPKISDSEIESQKKKDRPYGMLCHMPYYFLLDDIYIKEKISQGIVDKTTYDLYLQRIKDIKHIKRDLTNDDLDEVSYKRYSYLWENSYLTILSSKILECVTNIERSLFKDYLNKFAEVTDYDFLAQLFAEHFYHDYSIKKVDDLFKQRKGKISDGDDDDSEDTSFDIVVTKDNVYSLLDTFKNAIVKRVNLSFLGISSNKKILDKPDSQDTSDVLMNNFLLMFAKAFDHQYRIKSISFKCDDYLDKTEVFDYLKHPVSEKSYIPPKLLNIRVNDDYIEFKERLHQRASKKSYDEELPSQEILDYGTYLHRLLELVDLHTKDTSFIKNDHDRKIIDKVLRLDIFDNLDNAIVYQEYAYYDEELLSTGIIDLLIIKDNKYYIIDYKAKHTGDEAYINQLHTYKRNITRIFNIEDTSNINMYLLSILDCKIIKID